MKHDPQVDRWMDRCLALSKQAEQQGEPGVGAVIARDGEIVAEGSEQVKSLSDVAAHAELQSIRAACARLRSLDLSGCVLVTNVEPCWMCSYAIRETRISTVVVGRPIEGTGGITSPHPLLTDNTVLDWGRPPRIVWWRPDRRGDA